MSSKASEMTDSVGGAQASTNPPGPVQHFRHEAHAHDHVGRFDPQGTRPVQHIMHVVKPPAMQYLETQSPALYGTYGAAYATPSQSGSDAPTPSTTTRPTLPLRESPPRGRRQASARRATNVDLIPATNKPSKRRQETEETSSRPASAKRTATPQSSEQPRASQGGEAFITPMEMQKYKADQAAEMRQQQQQMQQQMQEQMMHHTRMLQEEFAKQMADMTSALNKAIASKDDQLASAQRVIDQSQAEARDAVGQMQAEAAAARSFHSQAQTAKQELLALQAQQAQQAESEREVREGIARDTALRVEARSRVSMESVEIKAQRYHDTEMGRMQHELSEARAAPPTTTPGEAPPPCPHCPVKQATIDRLRDEASNMDKVIQDERLKVIAADEAKSLAESALHDVQATGRATNAEMQSARKRIAQLETQVSEGALLQTHTEKERDEARNNHRNAEEEFQRRLRNLAEEYDQKLAATTAEFEQHRSELIERINEVECENEDLKSRPPQAEPVDVPVELAVARAELKSSKVLEAELRKQIELLTAKPVGLSSTRSHHSASRYSASADDEYDEDEQEEDEEEGSYDEGQWDEDWEPEGGEGAPATTGFAVTTTVATKTAVGAASSSGGGGGGGDRKPPLLPGNGRSNNKDKEPGKANKKGKKPGGGDDDDPESSGNGSDNSRDRRSPRHWTSASGGGGGPPPRVKEGEEVKFTSLPRTAAEFESWFFNSSDAVTACAADGEAAFQMMSRIDVPECTFDELGVARIPPRL